MPKRKRKNNKELTRMYSRDVIEFAKGLYLQRISGNKIAQKVRETFNCTVTAKTIMRWINDEGWEEEREKKHINVIQELVDNTPYDIAQRTMDQISAYQLMQKKGLDSLKVEDREVKSPEAAANMIDTGIRGERQISLGFVRLLFVGQVIDVIDSEVRDPDDRARVIRKLRGVAAEWGDKGM